MPKKLNPALLAQLDPELDQLFDDLERDIFDAWVASKDRKHRDDLWAMKLAAEQLKGLIREKIRKYNSEALQNDLAVIRGTKDG